MEEKIIIFKPNQKSFDFLGKTVEIPKFVQKNAKNYIFDKNSQNLLKICYDCKENFEVMHYDFDQESWIDIHDESDIHLHGQSGFSTRCRICDEHFKAKKKLEEKNELLKELSNDGLINMNDETSYISELSLDNEKFIKIVAVFYGLTENQILNMILTEHKKRMNFKIEYKDDWMK